MENPQGSIGEKEGHPQGSVGEKREIPDGWPEKKGKYPREKKECVPVSSAGPGHSGGGCRSNKRFLKASFRSVRSL